jgi:SpoVK/Ycf46/Vps4 family AAA+-type ATPase
MANPEIKPNPTPENPNGGFNVTLPKDIDTFYEVLRNSAHSFWGETESFELSHTPINDLLFHHETTTIELKIVERVVWSFKINGELYFSPNIATKEELDFYSGKDNIIKILNRSLKKGGYVLDNYDYKNSEARITVGHPDDNHYICITLGSLEHEIEKPRHEHLSEREYQKELELYNEANKKKILKLTNKSIKINFEGTGYNDKGSLQFHYGTFRSAIEGYAKYYEEIVRALYENAGINPPNLTVTLKISEREVEKNAVLVKNEEALPEEKVKAIVEEQKEEQERRKEDEWEGFEEIAGQDEAVTEAKKLVLAINRPEIYEKRGVKQPKGILFYGPPGTGKTLLAKAIAKESGAEFIEVSVADIGSKWHGESEKMMQAFFDQANEASGRGKRTIIFFDELDSLAMSRGDMYEVSRKVLSIILQNMDGMRSNRYVTVIAATNRPEDIDPGIKRSGRFDKLIEVGLPSVEGRIAILKKHMDKAIKASSEPGALFSQNIDFALIGDRTNGMSGADLANLVNLTLESKLTAELEGITWTPITTEELTKMIGKMGRIKKEQGHLGFNLSNK